MKFLLATILCTLLVSFGWSQKGQLIGIVDDKMVEVNLENGSLSILNTINMPNGIRLYNLAYSTDDCVFYSVVYKTPTPRLASIDLDGNYTDIGPIRYNEVQVAFCESLAFNRVNKKLYGSVSLNGGISNGDYSTESLVEINPHNGDCTLISTFETVTNIEGESDNFTFIDNVLYFQDGTPQHNTTFINVVDFSALGALISPNSIYSSGYLPLRDFAAIGDLLYIPTLDRDLYVLNTIDNSFNYLAQTHTSSDYNNREITGLEYVAIQELELFNIDTLICEKDELTITVDIDNAISIWNTGEISNTITISSPGLYWADLMINNCYYTSDTIRMQTVACDTCTQIYNHIQEELIIGNDTTLCIEESINLQLDLNDDYVVNWNNGEIGTIAKITETGLYSAEVRWGDCLFTTNSIAIEYVECSACQYYIPNIISAQTNTTNSTFAIFFNDENCDILSTSLSIYDRWGELIFKSDNNEWSGNFNDYFVNPGVYFYKFEFTSQLNGTIQSQTETGTFTIVK